MQKRRRDPPGILRNSSGLVIKLVVLQLVVKIIHKSYTITVDALRTGEAPERLLLSADR